MTSRCWRWINRFSSRNRFDRFVCQAVIALGPTTDWRPPSLAGVACEKVWPYGLYSKHFNTNQLVSSSDGPQPAILQEVNLPIWTNPECSRKYGAAAPGGIIESMLCAGQAAKDSCSVRMLKRIKFVACSNTQLVSFRVIPAVHWWSTTAAGHRSEWSRGALAAARVSIRGCTRGLPRLCPGLRRTRRILEGAGSRA